MEQRRFVERVTYKKKTTSSHARGEPGTRRKSSCPFSGLRRYKRFSSRVQPAAVLFYRERVCWAGQQLPQLSKVGLPLISWWTAPAHLRLQTRISLPRIYRASHADFHARPVPFPHHPCGPVSFRVHVRLPLVMVWGIRNKGTTTLKLWNMFLYSHSGSGPLTRTSRHRTCQWATALSSYYRGILLKIIV
jgi:hypothetical protein